MNNLSVQLLIKPKCKLIAVDNTSISSLIDITKYISVEFLVPYDSEVVDFNTLVFKEYKHNREEYNFNTSEISITHDGTYIYYKFFIPTLNYLIEIANIYNTPIKDQTFYYKDNLYFIDVDIDTKGEELKISDVINKAVKLDNYLSIWDAVKNGKSSQTLSCQQKFFSACHLQHCLIELQKAIIFSSKTCKKCEQQDSIRFRRDFLLSALYVLDHLILHQDYDEAQRILDNLSSCSSLCGDDIEIKDDCGCGGIKY